MFGTEIELPVDDGVLAGLDFGGQGTPVLVGHSTGGYAVTAAAAAGLVQAAAVCVVDGAVLDGRAAAAIAHAQWSTPEAAERLRAMFRYGWAASGEEMDAYVEQCVREAGSDWLYPSVDVYESISCPLCIVLAAHGLYAQRSADVQKVIEKGRDRWRADVASNHNVPMTQPGELAKIILEVVRRAES